MLVNPQFTPDIEAFEVAHVATGVYSLWMFSISDFLAERAHLQDISHMMAKEEYQAKRNRIESPLGMFSSYGVADNIQQVVAYHREYLNTPDKYSVISFVPILRK